MNTRLLFGLLLLTPTLCFGALSTTTSYFLNVEALTNVTARSAVRGLTGVFTNGLTAGASTFTGNLTLGDSSQATYTLSSALSGATDPVLTFQNNAISSSGNIFGTTGTSIQGVFGNTTSTNGMYGFYSSGARLALIADGTVSMLLGNGFNIFCNGKPLAFESGATGVGDAFIYRDGAANTLALRNGTAAQTLRIYNTYTDASNYERFIASWGSGVFSLGTDNAGTGSARTLQIGTAGSAQISLYTANTVRWNVSSSGHLLAQADNTYDIGASGATRPRNLYLANEARAVYFIAVQDIQAGAAASFELAGRSRIKSGANGDVLLVNNASTDFNRLQFGGTTASFPALKRSTTELQVRLADDSADGGLKSGSHTTTGIHVMTPSTLQTLAAANALLANAKKVRVVGSGGAVTLTSTPTIADGTDGQYVMIQGTDDTNTLTVQDQGSLASSNLELGAATRVLGAGDVLCLTFDTTASVWYEVSFANN